MQTSLPNAPTYAEHASDIIATAANLIGRGQPFALITSLAIEGGAAREVGSLAVVEISGEMHGYLSNGCIDRDIHNHALAALQSSDKTLIRYGDGSRFADLKLPCGGALEVLIDPKPDVDAILVANAELAARRPAIMQFTVEGRYAAFTYAPRFRLCLAGRGAVFRSVALAGKATGFEICLLSPDTTDLAALEQLASQTPVHLVSLQQADGMEMLDEYSAFLTLFHDHDWEPGLLQAALTTDALFIGSLGSRRTHDMRCDTLRERGVSETQLSRLRGPIGLVPSLRDASFIAVSALAAIVAALPKAIQQSNRM
jgi:xanthine dehydrogenase accessory factor